MTFPRAPATAPRVGPWVASPSNAPSPIDAPPATRARLVDDFHQWTKWSPWEDLDPSCSAPTPAPEKGVGAHYAWTGNRKAGIGSMEITGSTPEAVDITVNFLKPFKATNQTTLVLRRPSGARHRASAGR